MTKFLCIFYRLKLRFLINYYVTPSKKVNQEILNLHLKLNTLERLSEQTVRLQKINK